MWLREKDRKQLEVIYSKFLNERGLKKTSFANEVGLSDATIRNVVNKGHTTRTSLNSILDKLEMPKDHPLYGVELTALPAISHYKKSIRKISPIIDELLGVNKFVKVTLSLVLAILIGGIFVFLFMGGKDDVSKITRQSFQNDLPASNISLAPRDVEDYFRNGDIETIKSASNLGLSIKQIEAALKKSAPDFFKSTIGNRSADNWFKKVLTKGLNPELRTFDKYYGTVSILFAALRGENFKAVLSLLEAGASPHAYQDIVGTKNDFPFMMFPAHQIASYERFSNKEKKTLIKTMFSNFVAFYKRPESKKSSAPFEMGANILPSTESGEKRVLELTGKKANEAALGCDFKRSQKRCKIASKLTGKDWCKIMNDVPAVINVVDLKISDVAEVYVQDLINVSNNSGYFNVAHFNGTKSRLGILEVTPDRGTFNLLLYGRKTRYSKTLCKNGDHRSWCWLKYKIRRTTGDNALLKEHYKTKLIPSCKSVN